MKEVEAGVEEKKQRENTTLYMLIVLSYPSVLNRALNARAPTMSRQMSPG
jgi:hypothetical protein